MLSPTRDHNENRLLLKSQLSTKVDPELNNNGDWGSVQHSEKGIDSNNIDGSNDTLVASGTMCAQCGALIRNVANVSVHMRRHLGYKPYCCSTCNHSGFDEEDIRRHISRAHESATSPPRVSYKPQTDMEGQVTDLISRSRNVDTQSSSSTCSQDKGSNSTYGPSTLHSLLIHGSPTKAPASNTHLDDAFVEFAFFKCGFCNQNVAHNSLRIVQHLRFHLDFDGYRCSVCSNDQTFATFASLKEHVTSDHADSIDFLDTAKYIMRDQILIMVELAFSREESKKLTPASLTTPRLKCSLCSSKVNFTRQHVWGHAAEHVSYEAYKCAYCSHSQSTTEGLIQHIRSSHPSALLVVKFSPSLGKVQDVAAKIGACFPCLTVDFIESIESEKRGNSFTGSVAFVQPTSPDEPVEKLARTSSVREVSSPVMSRDTKCSVCSEYVSSDPQSLVAHAKIHLSMRTYHCHYCSFQHHEQMKMKRHLMQKHPSKPATNFSSSPVAQNAGRIRSAISQCFGSIGTSISGSDIDFLLRLSDGRRSGLDTSSDTSYSIGLQRSMQSRVRAVTAEAESPAGSSGSVGKKLCLLCRTFIANNPSSFENHACKHLDYKPFRCFYCPYQSYIRGKVTRHIQQVHHGLKININHEPIPGIKDKIARVKYCCFPDLAPAGVDVNDLQVEVDSSNKTDDGTPIVGKLEEYLCRRCQARIPTDQTSIDKHLEKHVDASIRLFTCPVCPFSCPDPARARHHLNGMHADQKVTRVLCCPNGRVEELEELRVDCFGPRTEDIPASSTATFPSFLSDSMGYSGSRSASRLSGLSELAGASHKQVDDLPPSRLETGMSNGDSNGLIIGSSDDDEPMDSNECNVQCAVCDMSVGSDSGSITEHLRLHHVDLDPYSCGGCSFRASDEDDVLEHIEREHADDVEAPQPIYTPVTMALEEWQEKCFPNLVATDQFAVQSFGTDNRSPGRHGLRKLTCKLVNCGREVADNPKSIGIHVKNHLNYKPYRCPVESCNYLSCEQSKVRRHMENVHSRPGDDLVIDNSDDENIKQKIAETKIKCFPSLIFSNNTGECDSPMIGDDDSMDASGSPVMCRLCNTSVSFELAEEHIRLHMKRFKCTHCDETFASQELLEDHTVTEHPDLEQVITVNADEEECSHAEMKQRCFPELYQETDDDSVDSSWDISARTRLPDYMNDDVVEPKRVLASDQTLRICCNVCDQPLAGNTNSLDVHAKNHLDYKPHQCGYCEYRSCISGKVKRHLDTVHRGLPTKIVSPNHNTIGIKEIIQNAKYICFPVQFVQQTAAAPPFTLPDDKSSLNSMLFKLRRQLQEEIRLTDLRSGDEVRGIQTVPKNAYRPAPSCGRAASATEDSASILTYTDHKMAGNSGDQREGELTCSLCWASLDENCSPSVVNEHITFHMTTKHLACTICKFMHCDETTMQVHLQTEHDYDGEAAAPVTLSDADVDGDVAHWRQLCFGVAAAPVGAEDALEYIAEDEEEDIQDEEGEGDVKDAGAMLSGARYICQLCEVAVSQYASSLYIHVKNHMDYKPYHCGFCSYRSPVKSKVRRHCANTHKHEPVKVLYTPKPGVEKEIMEWKRRCFPDAHQASNLSSGKISCGLCHSDVADTPLSRKVHAMNHLDAKPHHCSYCNYRSCLKGETRRHMTRQHPNQDINILFQHNEVATRKQVDSMIDRCFTVNINNNNSISCSSAQTAIKKLLLHSQPKIGVKI